MDIAVFDGHCDTLCRLNMMPQEHLAGNSGHWDLLKCQNFQPQAQFFALYWDSKGPLYKHMVKREYKNFLRELKIFREGIAHCRSVTEAKQAWKEGKVAAFLSLEGAELVGCTTADVKKIYDMGVRAVNLTWNHANALSGSHCDEPERGLSEAGRAYVQEMQQLGMLVDVSHLSDAGFWDVMELTKRPVIASHSNSRNVYSHTRNLTDEQFTAIMKYHGAVGLNVYADFLGGGTVTEETLLAHLEHFLSLGGAHTVALGGDWDGCSRLPENWSGIWNWKNFYNFLLQQNYSEDLVNDIFFNNLMKAVGRVCP